jgi:putative protease
LPPALFAHRRRRRARFGRGEVFALPELLAAGVSCFKIEGRLKGPEYVANVVDKYRRALDAAILGKPLDADEKNNDERALRFTFSRDFSPGFLLGSDHQSLVHGRFPGHRGVPLGRVQRVQGPHVYIDGGTEQALHGGDRMLFAQARPEENEPRATLHAADIVPSGVKLVFGAADASEIARVRVGDEVYKSRDAHLARALKTIIARPRRVPLDLRVSGIAGEPLRISASDSLGRQAEVASTMPLTAADRPLEETLLREKLGFGTTPFVLRGLALALEGAVGLPPSELKRMRRVLSDALSAQPVPFAEREVQARPEVSIASVEVPLPRPGLVPLLRTLEQVETTLTLAGALGIHEVALDFMELVGLGEAVRRVREAGLAVIIATPRVQKPGEEAYDKRFERLAPDGILARHLGALEHFSSARTRNGAQSAAVYGDFSLNATNALTARTLLAYGLRALTPAYDMNLEQLLDVARGVDARRLEVTLHQHLPLYHTEHCVYSHLLSSGRDYRTCGRPCEAHTLALREDNGLAHPVLVDIGCRNTVFNARAQSAAACLPELRAAGVSRFRVELVREDAATTRTVLTAYAALLAGQRSAERLSREVGALEKYGVSAGTLAVLQ